MFRTLCRLYFQLRGWKMDKVMPEGVEKCVMIAAPHTSNMDFIFMMGAFEIVKLNLRFTIKKEWMRFPYSLIMRPLGGIGIDRSPKVPGEKRLSMVEAMTNLFENKDELIIVVTPEGSRSIRSKWKTGFYHVAEQANVPIMLGYVDYGKKQAGVGKKIVPSGDMDADIREIMNFYQQITPCHPEKFALDIQYRADNLELLKDNTEEENPNS